MRSSGRVPEQLQPGPVGAPDADEPRGGWAEHELEHIPPVAAHLQASTLLMHG
jgi:hypothetical protein